MHECARLMRKWLVFDRICRIKLLVTKELKKFIFFGFGRLLCVLLVDFLTAESAENAKGF